MSGFYHWAPSISYAILNNFVVLIMFLLHVIQVGAQTETELKEKKLRVEDALNATKVELFAPDF